MLALIYGRVCNYPTPLTQFTPPSQSSASPIRTVQSAVAGHQGTLAHFTESQQIQNKPPLR